MMFQRRHYIAIADVLRRRLDDHRGLDAMERVTIIRLADDLAGVFRNDNDRFQYTRFMSRAGIETR